MKPEVPETESTWPFVTSPGKSQSLSSIVFKFKWRAHRPHFSKAGISKNVGFFFKTTIPNIKMKEDRESEG